MLFEELFRLSGILYDPCSPEDLDSAFEDVTSQTIISLQQMVEELVSTVEEVCMSWNLLIHIVLAQVVVYWMRSILIGILSVNIFVYLFSNKLYCQFMPLQLENENKTLKDRLAAGERSDTHRKEGGGHTSSVLHRLSDSLSSFVPWFWPLSSIKLLKWRLIQLVPELEFYLIWGSYCSVTSCSGFANMLACKEYSQSLLAQLP